MLLFKLRHLISILYILCIFNTAVSQPLNADAGPDNTLCPNGNVIVGGSPSGSGGQPPYTYSWSPADGLSNTTISNPTAAPGNSITYTLTVTDDTGAVQTDMVDVIMSQLFFTSAGSPTDLCLNQSVPIGGANNPTLVGVSYSWSPAASLNDPTLPQPTAEPDITTVYTLTSTTTGCPPKIDSVKVTVIQPPPIYAGEDITIKEGERATLHASGGYNYAWSGNSLTYPNTADPDAEPILTSNYILYGTDATNRCFAYDTMTVFVEPGNDVVFYNTFSPNGDGNNDTWYIGNILKYPNNRLEIYNRNGKLIYKANGYANLWDGKTYLGEQLPPATYFYIMELRDGAGTYKGTVSIVK
jgi:gliding motility-associated-like protein